MPAHYAARTESGPHSHHVSEILFARSHRYHLQLPVHLPEDHRSHFAVRQAKFLAERFDPNTVRAFAAHLEPQERVGRLDFLSQGGEFGHRGLARPSQLLSHYGRQPAQREPAQSIVTNLAEKVRTNHRHIQAQGRDHDHDQPAVAHQLPPAIRLYMLALDDST
jgi:hypothetical protein